jgi:phenylacetic acid degradation operon negative regulatory protein
VLRKQLATADAAVSLDDTAAAMAFVKLSHPGAIQVLKRTTDALSPFAPRIGGKIVRRAIPASQGPAEKFGNLQPQEVILGLFGEYVGLDEQAWSGGLVQLLGDLGFSGGASRVAFNRVIRRGLLAPVKQARFVFYKITPRLKIVHDEGRRQTFSAFADPPWTGEWTLTWYAVPERHRLQRARLGRWLNLRGYGALQDGTWISTGNCEKEVRDLATRLGISKHVIVFVGRLEGDRTSLNMLLDHAWHIGDLKRIYDKFVKAFGPYIKDKSFENLSERECFIIRTRLIEMFRYISTQDPRIPDEILGIDWRRREAIEIFHQLHVALRDKAAAYFRGQAVTG